VAPARINTTQLPAGAFQAEFRAVQESSQANRQLIGATTGLLFKIEAANDVRIADEALLAAQQYDDRFAVEMLKDRDYATQADRYDQGFAAATEGLGEGMSSRGRKRLELQMASRRSRGRTRTEADAYLSMAAAQRRR
jgi:hypothetical protein